MIDPTTFMTKSADRRPKLGELHGRRDPQSTNTRVSQDPIYRPYR